MLLITQCSLEIISAEMAITFQMPNDRFNDPAASEFFFDGGEDTPLLAGAINTMLFRIIVTTITPIQINALGLKEMDPISRTDLGIG